MSSLFILVLIIGFVGLLIPRLKTVAGYMMAIGLGIIFGEVSSEIPDYILYQNAYESSIFTANLKFEYGYEFLTGVLQKVGFNYIEFRLFVGIAGLILITYFINKLNINSISILFIYIINCFFIDVSQVRNFMLMVFLIMAFVTLIEGKKYNFLKSLVYILVGASFQSLGYFFLSVYLVILVYRMKKLRVVLSLMFIIVTAVFVLPVIRDYIIALSSSILGSGGPENDKINTYIGDQTRLGFLLPWSIILVSIGFSIYNLNLIKQFKLSETVLVERTHSILLVTMLSLPLLAFNIEFYRIYRDTFLLIPISAMFIFKNITDHNNKPYVFWGLILIIIIHFVITILPVWNSNVTYIF